MAESIFHLSSLITDNFDKEVQKRFLTKYKLYSEYIRSNLKFNIFVQECINDNRVNQRELAEYLFEDLLYGNQRQIFMYEIFSINKDIEDQSELLKSIQEQYPLIDSLYYNEILFQPHNDEILDLVGIKISLKLNSTKVHKINLLFSEKCNINNLQGRHGEYSYVTIEIDLIKKLLFVKVKPKSRVIDEKQKPIALQLW